MQTLNLSLQFLRREHGRLRADNYRDIQHTIINQDGDSGNAGQKVILSATFSKTHAILFEGQQK